MWTVSYVSYREVKEVNRSLFSFQEKGRRRAASGLPEFESEKKNFFLLKFLSLLSEIADWEVYARPKILARSAIVPSSAPKSKIEKSFSTPSTVHRWENFFLGFLYVLDIHTVYMIMRLPGEERWYSTYKSSVIL